MVSSVQMPLDHAIPFNQDANIIKIKCTVVSSPESVIHSVTTPGTEQSIPTKAGKEEVIEKSKGSTAAPEEHKTPYFHTPSSSERGDSPIVQEPEDIQLHQEQSPRRTSLVIVESTDEQPEKFERYYEDESLEKVNTSPVVIINQLSWKNKFPLSSLYFITS